MSLLYLDQRFIKDKVIAYSIARISRVVPLFVAVVLMSYLLQKYGVNRVLYDIPKP